jgi:putative sterol carrier protein
MRFDVQFIRKGGTNMQSRASLILFITSFFPVAAFKAVARIGEASLARAKWAATIGLVLAGTQVILSSKWLGQSTYLEKAFLGFLGAAALWVFLTPPSLSALFVEHSTTLLYLTLLSVTLLPQVFGYDPFTYAIAKQWTPEAVWKTLQFRTINLHIAYFWSALFFLASLSCGLGQGKPFYSSLLPLVLVLGVGLPFSKIYPGYYLKKEFASPSAGSSFTPQTAKELISGMPRGFDPIGGKEVTADIQFEISGEGGGNMVLSIAGGRCTFREGVASSPLLTIRSPGEIWLKIARGEINRAKALMDGLYQVEGDMGLLLKMGELFRTPSTSTTSRLSPPHSQLPTPMT